MICRQNDIQIISWLYQLFTNVAFLCAVICDSALGYKEQQDSISFAARSKGYITKKVDVGEANEEGWDCWQMDERSQQQRSKCGLESQDEVAKWVD